MFKGLGNSHGRRAKLIGAVVVAIMTLAVVSAHQSAIATYLQRTTDLVIDTAQASLSFVHGGSGDGWSVGTLSEGEHLTFVSEPATGSAENRVTFLQNGDLDLAGELVADVSDRSGAAGREAIALRGSPDNQDVGVDINKSRLFIWDSQNNKRAQLLAGQLIANVSGRSGAAGREAIKLRGSPDNQDIGIDINKPRLFIWDSQNNKRANLIVGDFQATGSKSAAIETRSHGDRLVYSVESPGVWIEDYGSAELTNGQARVDLDPTFLETVTVNEDHPMKVFVQLTGEAHPTVVEKHESYFVVKETMDGQSNASFDYRVVAKRKGYEETRLEPAQLGN